MEEEGLEKKEDTAFLNTKKKGEIVRVIEILSVRERVRVTVREQEQESEREKEKKSERGRE